MKLITYDPGKQKVVLCGYWNREKNFLARLVEPKHFMKINQSYGMQEIAFQEVIARKITKIVLKEKMTGDLLIAPIKTWLEHGKVMEFGHGKQRFLSITYMRRQRANH